MKPISLFTIPKAPDKNAPRSERAELVGKFLVGVNKGERQYKAAYIAFRLSHIKTPDLYYFLKLCEGADIFSKCFFGLLKVNVDKR